MFDSLTPQQRAFLTAFSSNGKCCLNVSKSAKAAKVERHTHYHWLATSAPYRDAYKDARKMAGDVLVEDAVEFAREGTESLVLHQGAPVMIPTGKMIPHPEGKTDHKTGEPIMVPQLRPLIKRTRSTRLHLALLAAALPEQFGTRKVEHSGTVNLKLAERIAAARQRLARERSAGADTGPNTRR